MTKKLEQELEEIKTKVNALEEKLKDKQKGWLKTDTMYWAVANGVVYGYNFRNSTWDKYRLQTRNIFRTKENAELWLKIHNRVHELIGDNEKQFNQGRKYYLIWNFELKVPRTFWDIQAQVQGTTYMPKEVAEQLIEEFGNDLKIWICGEEL
jgi:hypothetical protein